MLKPLKYLLFRLKPFALIFLACALLARIAITHYQWADISTEPSALIKAFLIGSIFDGAVFLYFAALISFYLLCLPAHLHNTRPDRIITVILFFIFTYVISFAAVGEWFFWDEFQSRYNFIAVDYLVYTREVVGNIQESYPLYPVLIGLGLFTLFCTRFTYVDLLTSSLKTCTIRKRFILFTGCFLLACFSFLGANTQFATISTNRYINEIARNGIFELFAAFKNNELDYNQFYAQLPKEEVISLIQDDLGNLGSSTGFSPLQRKITSAHQAQSYNLIVVTVESLSADFMKRFGNPYNLTPHLDALAQKSLFFSNLYATGTRTVYGLAALTLSMPPVPGNSIVRRADNGGLFTLGSVLKENNYTTKFIYGGFGYFDNMNAFFAANGYDIIDRSDLGKDEITFVNIWGVSDEDLFNRVLKEADRDEASKKPFFSMVMTTSNHRPYTFPAGKIDLPSGGGRSAGVKYTDYALHAFLEKAVQHKWFKNTIIVIVADHTAGSAGKIEIDPAKYHIPMFVYAPHIIKPGIVDKLASQIDVAPTLLGLMNISYESHFYGHDLMHPSPNRSPNRAFVSSYQKLGYLTPEGLVLLTPGMKADFYAVNQNIYTKAGPPPKNMKDKAIAYYQGASLWKDWSKQPEKE